MYRIIGITICLVISLIVTNSYADSLESQPLVADTKETELTKSVARLKDSLRHEQSGKSNLVKDSLNDWSESTTKATETSPIFGMFKGLGFCLAAFFIGLSVYKKFRPQKLVAQSGRMQVINRLALTSKTQLIMARVDNKEVLIAVGSEQVALIENNKETENYSLIECEEEVCDHTVQHSV